MLHTDQAEDEQLLNELLALDPEWNPITWLMDDHTKLCVKLLFWQSLDILRSGLLSKQRDIALKKMDMIGIAQQSTLNIGYRFNEHDVSLLKPLVLTHPLTVDDQQLLQIFSKLRRREMVDVTGDRLNAQAWDLRNKLLSLAYDVNPLIWLRENYLQYAAVSTLEYLMRQVTPSGMGIFSTSDSSRFESLSPKSVCRAQGIKFVLETISYINDVFSIYIVYRITNRRLKDLEKVPITVRHGHVEWRGIGTLFDDRENYYLICHSLLNYSGYHVGRDQWLDYSLRLDCYPALVKSARQLVLSFDNVTLIAKEISSGANLEDDALHYSVPLGNLKWTINLSGFKRRLIGSF